MDKVIYIFIYNPEDKVENKSMKDQNKVNV